MKKMVLGGKKGLSDVVTTVLIVLVALVAVAVIGSVILSNVNKSARQVDTLTICQGLELTVTSCTKPTGVVGVTRGADTSGVGLSKYKLIYDVAGSVTTLDGTSGSAVNAYESKTITPTAGSYTAALSGALSLKVKVAPIITSSGTDYTCRAIEPAVDCI